MTGALSLIDVLLGIPIEEAVKSFLLEGDIKGALLKREGRLGDLLNLVEATERGTLENVKVLMDRYGVTPAGLYSLYLKAVADFSSLDL